MAGRKKKTETEPDLAVSDAPEAPAVDLPEPADTAPRAEESAVDLSIESDTAPAADPEPVPDLQSDPLNEPFAEPDPALPPPGAEAEVAHIPDPPAPEPAPAAAPAPAPARSNPLWPVLGGVVAAAIGFVAAQVVPQGWPLEATTRQLSAFEARLAAQDRKLADLAIPAPDPALADRLAALEQRLTELPATSGADPAAIDALRADIETLKQAVPPAPDLAPIQAELEALRAELAAIPRESGVAQELEALRAAAEAERAASTARAEALRAEGESLRAQAEATARAAVARGAILRVQAALESGGAFDAALADLGAAGVAVPATLSGHAEGVPTLAQLQAGFPDAARAALAATVQPAPDAALSDRLGAFLKGQTGLRSTLPRTGDDPDAVLSRAEAALRAGDLAATLAELDRLPPEATAVLADWRAQADIRAAAAAALADMAADLDAQ